MHRRMSHETEPLYESNSEREQETKKWDGFQDPPEMKLSDSSEDKKFVDYGEKVGKVLAYIVTFIVVLGCAVISKGTFLFMTSQIGADRSVPFCNDNYQFDLNADYTITLPIAQRVAWIWIVMFTFFTPQLGTFIRSVRMLVFKTWGKPTLLEFVSVFITESLQTVGLAILAYKVLPNMDVIKGAMLTNGVCLIPAILSHLAIVLVLLFYFIVIKVCGCEMSLLFYRLISRFTISNSEDGDEEDEKNRDPNAFLKICLDLICIVAQLSVSIVWPLVSTDSDVWYIPLAVILISVGWWENYITDDSVIGFIRVIAAKKRKFETSRYYVYVFVSLWKCLLFFAITFALLPSDLKPSSMFDKFVEAFSEHQIFLSRTEPVIESNTIASLLTTPDALYINASILTPVWVLLINVVATYMCYAFGKFACKIYIQGFSFALPINLTVPVTISILLYMCWRFDGDPCAFAGTIPEYLFFTMPDLSKWVNFVAKEHTWIWLLWLLSQAWITVHIWTPSCEKLASTERLYVKPMFDPFLIDQDTALNRRRNDPVDNTTDNTNQDHEGVNDKDSITRIYACGTMWHETTDEMMEFLKSILRLDEDQCARRIVREYYKFNLPDYYELQTHIFFDDAFVRSHQDDPDPQINIYVKQLVEAIDEAASEVHETIIRVRPPKKYLTPYGGRLVWTLPGRTEMIVHLKDKKKIRAKKRWSQVMYMYYLLGHKLMEKKGLSKQSMAENTYLLALDGDIDFQPKAVHLLVELMKKNKSLGAACGRIHPVGSGPLVWYQMFEYGVGHWLQKATEHIIGCVLCSPGCFSLFRGSALMDDSVMKKYTTKSSEARHYVQYDQGEDRWLCTLLLKRGYRVEYTAASDAFTHCPEGFSEFYNQRRRWIPATMANVLDLLMASKATIKINDSISFGYIIYQAVLLIGTVLGPGTVFLMLVGAFVAVFQLDQWSSFLWNVVPVLFFVIVCTFFTDDKIQLFVAGILSGMYVLIMMAVLVGVVLQISNDGFLAPTSLFFFCVAAQMIITAFLHPRELNCLKFGVVYFVTVPSMFMLLVIYSVFNMNNVSWGTREVTVAEQPAVIAPGTEPAKENSKKSKIFRCLGAKEEDNSGGVEFSMASLFKCMCCTHKDDKELMNTRLDELMTKLVYLEKGDLPELQQVPRRRTTMITGLKMETQFESTNSDTQSILETVSEDIFGNTWIDDRVLQRGEVDFIDGDEREFWNGLLEKYLHPIDDTKDKARIQQNLKDLRDKVVLAFFMINALFVLVVFLLTLNNDDIHIKWPLEVRINFTYIDDAQQIIIYKEHLRLEPIGVVFLVGFASLLIVQFLAMLLHRFQTFSQILANTVVSYPRFNKSTENLGPEEILERDVLDEARKLQKLKRVDDSDDEERVELPPDRRKTVHRIEKTGEKNFKITSDLDKAFERRTGKVLTKENYRGPVRRDTVMQLEARKSRIEARSLAVIRRPTMMGHNNPAYGMDEATV